MYEDLLHELYEALLNKPEETVLRESEKENLRNLGIMTIRDLYQRRNCNGAKSPTGLSEVKGVEKYQDPTDKNYNNNNNEYDPDPFRCLGEEDQTWEDELERKEKDRRLDDMNALINMNKSDEKIQLLVMVSNEGATVVAKEMGISRQRVYYKMNEIKQTLREHIK